MDEGGIPLLPDSLVYQIFLNLGPADVLAAGLVCHQWQAVSRDEFLWREQFYRYYQVARNVPRHPGQHLHSALKPHWSSCWSRTARLCLKPQGLGGRPEGGQGWPLRRGPPVRHAHTHTQRPHPGTRSFGGSMTPCPAWRCRLSRSTPTRSCTLASPTQATSLLPAPRTAP